MKNKTNALIKIHKETNELLIYTYINKVLFNKTENLILNDLTWFNPNFTEFDNLKTC